MSLCVKLHCSALQCVAMHLRFVRVIRQYGMLVLQWYACVAVCRRVSQCVAVCRSVLKCVAVQCVAFMVCARDRCVMCEKEFICVYAYTVETEMPKCLNQYMPHINIFILAHPYISTPLSLPPRPHTRTKTCTRAHTLAHTNIYRVASLQ